MKQCGLHRHATRAGMSPCNLIDRDWEDASFWEQGHSQLQPAEWLVIMQHGGTSGLCSPRWSPREKQNTDLTLWRKSTWHPIRGPSDKHRNSTNTSAKVAVMSLLHMWPGNYYQKDKPTFSTNFQSCLGGWQGAKHSLETLRLPPLLILFQFWGFRLTKLSTQK